MNHKRVAVIVQPVVSPCVPIIENTLTTELQVGGYDPLILTADTNLEDFDAADLTEVVRFATRGTDQAKRMGVTAPWVSYVFPVIIDVSVNSEPVIPQHVQFLFLKNERGCEWLWVEFFGSPLQPVVKVMSDTICAVLGERSFPSQTPQEKRAGEKLGEVLKRAMTTAYKRAEEKPLLN